MMEHTIKIESFDGSSPVSSHVGETGIQQPAVEEDIYEDTGDLEFELSPCITYLSRLPKFLWKTWAQMKDGEELSLGTMRVESDHGLVQRMSLLLPPDFPQSESLPREYHMHVANKSPVNTYIFSEQDLPGFADRLSVDTRPSRATELLPSRRLQPPDQPNNTTAPDETSRKWHPYYRKVIPKKTAICARVSSEIICQPVENRAYRDIMHERSKLAGKPKKETQLLASATPSTGNSIYLSGNQPAGNFSRFIKTAGSTRAKGQESRTARMPQNELLDLIMQCFREYKYWPLKALKDRLRQPEAYLKSTLENVAQLIRQGPFAMKWQLKPDMRVSNLADIDDSYDMRDEVAPDIDGLSDIGDGGE